MIALRDFDLVKTDTRRIAPAVTIRAASGTQAELARPWAIMSGQSAFDVAQFRDGTAKHAPELVTHLRDLFTQDMPQAPSLLIFVHRGHQIECMMPLLPSLMHAISYRGPAQAIRRTEGETEASHPREGAITPTAHRLR